MKGAINEARPTGGKRKRGTYRCSHEGCSPFEAEEPLAFTLPICADQLNKDIVKSGGRGQIRRENSHLVIHHLHSVQQKNPEGGRTIAVLSSDKHNQDVSALTV